MKKLFLLAVLAAAVASADAQESDSTYIPNRFCDNWEISVGGGLSYEICGQTWKRNMTDLGYGGDISVTKWINPYFGARLGTVLEYGHHTLDARFPVEHMLTFNPHFDFLWNLSNQLFGYKADRVYNAVPYIHVGAEKTHQN